MWDRLIASSNALNILPSGKIWALSNMSFDRVTMELSFKSEKTQERLNVKFDPLYYSISDEWVEAYSGLDKQKTDNRLEQVIEKIGQSWPDRENDYQNAATYFANAMEWSIRFVSYAPPELSLLNVKGLTNAN